MAVVNEAVAEVAEEVADNAEAIAVAARGWTAREGSLFTTGAFLGLVGGALAGWGFANRKLRDRYGKIAEEEISQMREHFHAKAVALEGKPALDGLVKDLGYVSVEEAIERGKSLKGPDPEALARGDQESQADHEETKNIFVDQPEHADDWDYEVELASRNQERPYVIHYDEQNERDYSTSTFTYYAGDDVLCDEKDKIIEDRDDIVGDHNLDRFGHGSHDPLIVYVRNDALSAEFEIVKSDKTYAEEVHGLSHGDYPRTRRARFDDEN